MSFDFEEIDITLERRILIGCIVSAPFIKQILPIYDRQFLSTNGARKIARWCMKFYEDYGKAPGKHIEDIFNAQVRKNTLDEDETQFIETILGLASEEWEQTEHQFNFDFLADECEEFFSATSLAELSKDISSLADKGEVGEALALVTNYKAVARPSSEGINPLSDKAAIQQAFESRTEPLFKLPGELGRYMNDQLYRGGFIAFQGPEKSGKSYMLQELIMRAIRGRCKVAIFEMGDMTRDDRLCRIHQYLCQRPFVRRKVESGKMKVRIPELLFDDEDEPFVKIREEQRPVLFWEDAIKMGERWEKRLGKDKVRLSTHFSDTSNVADIDNVLDHWEKTEGFIPDLIAIDYADILRPEDSKKAERSQINDTWKAMRSLSQKRNALVATVTQADSKAYGATSQTLKNFSEDKRKYAHITAMYSINQTMQEKPKGIVRIGTLLIREGRDKSHKEVAVLRCLDIGRPYMDSYEVDVDYEAMQKENEE